LRRFFSYFFSLAPIYRTLKKNGQLLSQGQDLQGGPCVELVQLLAELFGPVLGDYLVVSAVGRLFSSGLFGSCCGYFFSLGGNRGFSGSIFGGFLQSIFWRASSHESINPGPNCLFVEVFFGEGVDSFILASFDLMILYSREFVKEMVVKPYCDSLTMGEKLTDRV